MAATALPPREDLYVPDRFEGLREVGTGSLRSIVIPVVASLDALDDRFDEMAGARRGALMLMRGDTGAGKSTFLDTIGLFRQDVVTERVPRSEDIGKSLAAIGESTSPRVVVLEGREALGEGSRQELEAGLHAVNSFLRTPEGRSTLVVWPTNTDPLTQTLVELGEELGGEALFGVGEPVQHFDGPPSSEFISIAERTVAALNEGASLSALGITEARAEELAGQVNTIGRYLALVAKELRANRAVVTKLLPREQYRLWTVVIAGNDPEGEIAALTRGNSAYLDIDRLMTATGANIVKELKKFPDVLGLLGTVLDGKILHLDMVTTLSVARQFGDAKLHALMSGSNMAVKPDQTALDRLKSSELGVVLGGATLGTKKKGPKPGSSTVKAFTSLAAIAQTNDATINRAIGEGLRQAGLIDSFETEHDLGTDYTVVSDIYALRAGKPIRIEVMWRKTTSRAEIANYVLGKLGKYGRAVGLLET